MGPRCRGLLAALVGLVAGCPASPPPRSAPEPVRVGVVGGLTGPTAAYGVSQRQGVELALAGARIRGRPVQALHLDDQGSAEEARALAARLVSTDGVVALIGEATSEPALAMAEVAERARVPMLATAATLAAVTEVGPHVHRACFVDATQARAMARFARETLGLERVSVVRDLASGSSQALAAAFTEAFVAAGGRVVTQAVVEGDAGLADASAALVAAPADGVYVPSYYRTAAALARALRDGGFEGPLLGADGWGAEELLRRGGAAVEGAHFTDHFHHDEPGEAAARFVEAYRTRFNETPDAVAALGYDAARRILGALESGTAAAEIQAALRRPSTVEGVTGPTGEGGSKSVVIVRIRGGRTEFVRRLAPS
jgi:branched-chain amino acid transport system substrate-binding protein